MSDEPFARVTYTEAIDKLLESGKKFDYAVEWGVDLQTEHERYLSEELVQKTCHRYGLSCGNQSFLHEA